MEALLNETEIVNLLRGISIPAQPQILADLALAQASPDCDLSDIAKLISKDISISGSVLKVANSPFYGLTRPVTGIEPAILMVGLRGMMNIVNGVALREESLKRKDWCDEDLMFLNRFWDSAEDTARAAAYLSERIGLENPEEMYSIGLFHNAGIPLLLGHFKDYRTVLAEAYGSSESLLTDVEDHHYNTNHCVLGYYLARSWKMPAALCDVIVEHHNLLNLFKEGLNKGSTLLNRLALLKTAEHIVGLHYVQGRHELDLEWMAMQDLILAYLNLAPDEFEDIEAACEDLGITNQDLLT